MAIKTVVHIPKSDLTIPLVGYRQHLSPPICVLTISSYVYISYTGCCHDDDDDDDDGGGGGGGDDVGNHNNRYDDCEYGAAMHLQIREEGRLQSLFDGYVLCDMCIIKRNNKWKKRSTCRICYSFFSNWVHWVL